MDKSKRIIMIVGIAVISLIFLVALTTAVLVGTDVIKWKGGLKFVLSSSEEADSNSPTTAPTTPTEPTEPTSPPPTVNGNDYSGTEEETKNAAGVAVSTVGDLSLTNGELQVHYWSVIYQKMRTEYLQYYVNFGKPLNEQVYDAKTGMSWQEYLLKESLEIWHQMIAVRQYAEKSGFTLDAEGIEYVEKLDEKIEKDAKDGEYDSVEAMLSNLYGPSVTREHYKNYLYTSYYATAYINHYRDANAPTMEEIEAYFTKNESQFTSQGIKKDMGFHHDVRHILITPQSSTDENATTFTDAEWEACRVKAQNLLDEWLSGEATEDSFAELAKLHTEDPGSKEEGGLYTDVYKNQMVKEFNDWVFDESREYGHTGLVKTTYGYHIMFYVKSTPSWIVYTRNTINNEKLANLVNDAKKEYPISTDFDAIKLGDPDVLTK